MQEMNDEYGYEQAAEALSYIRSKIDIEPLTAVVLGSGLGGAARILDVKFELSASEIPHWPLSTAPGHSGKVLVGKIGSRDSIVLQGRVHCYEGYSMKAVTFSTRVLGMLGVREYIATNASGGINENYRPGDIIAVCDHINLMGTNPLAGKDEPRWNSRFPDMTEVYNRRFLKVLKGFGLRLGVYAAFGGPSFETPAEIRMARIMGADLVGMSTVPEVIVANAMGMEIAVLSCVSNMGAGLSEGRLSSEEVLRSSGKHSGRIESAVRDLIASIE